MSLTSVCHDDPIYNSAMIGNGEIVTMIGTTGYHNGYCLEDEQANRTIFWAGRRLRDAKGVRTAIPRVPPEELVDATIPLVRFGRLSRELIINGIPTVDDVWEQSMEYDAGMAVTTLEHGVVREVTESFICQECA